MPHSVSLLQTEAFAFKCPENNINKVVREKSFLSNPVNVVIEAVSRKSVFFFMRLPEPGFEPASSRSVPGSVS